MWEMAWSENPPVRYRHFVTNIRVRATDEPDVLDARSNVIVSAVRQSSPTTTLHAERFDLIVRTGGGMRLRSRFVVIDETVLDFASSGCHVTLSRPPAKRKCRAADCPRASSNR